jgi:hypothetical protein
MAAIGENLKINSERLWDSLDGDGQGWAGCGGRQ